MKSSIRRKIYIIIFETNTPAGLLFDIMVIFHILMSVGIMMVDSIPSTPPALKTIFNYVEWYITGIFLIEYLLRIYCSPQKLKYVGSFFGVVDILSILPSFLGLMVGNTQYLIVIRLLRVLRIFRVLRLLDFLTESTQLLHALQMSLRKIIIFIFAEIILNVVLGSIMYVIEGEANGFTSIPRSVYWAIVTMTTVGYGDISPQTSLGQAIAALFMIIAYSIVIIAAGMITIDMHASKKAKYCPHCNQKLPSNTRSRYCNMCGEVL